MTVTTTQTPNVAPAVRKGNGAPKSNPEVEALKAQLAALAAENAALKSRPTLGGKPTFRVSKSGAISCYGLQRMPVTLFAPQWERLLAEQEALKALIAEGRTGKVYTVRYVDFETKEEMVVETPMSFEKPSK